MVTRKEIILGIGWLSLFLFIASSQADQSQKIYELIYEDVQVLKKQLLLLQERWQNLASEIQGLKTQLQEIQATLKIWQKEMAETKNSLKEVPMQYQFLNDRLDQLGSRLERIAEDLVALKPPLSLPQTLAETKPVSTSSAEAKKKEQEEKIAKEMPPSVSGPSPQEIYNNAYSDYLKGNYELAIEGFKLYRDQFGESPLADNALYWIGECYFSLKNYEAAIAAFNEVILYYPKGDRVPAAYLKKGLSYLELGQKEEALAVLKLLVSRFPLQEEAKIAQQKIKELIEK
ncbi:MAG: tol-pal system protein YbgF [Candidatus Aminicenantes bacterium]|nr:tol-pal system protein YbgF [Candidatus Aminicenantes bacterium]